MPKPKVNEQANANVKLRKTCRDTSLKALKKLLKANSYSDAIDIAYIRLTQELYEK